VHEEKGRHVRAKFRGIWETNMSEKRSDANPNVDPMEIAKNALAWATRGKRKSSDR
jgi:hypothetical protein